MTLDELKIGKKAVIETVLGEGALRQHFLDMGAIPGTEVKMMKFAPMGDPLEIRLHGYELTLRLSEARKIEIRPVEEIPEKDRPKKKKRKVPHPGLGEEGIFHRKGDGTPLPENTTLTFALAGNQNSGKTTLFNQLTGSNQHVGNFPGVTVESKSGEIRGYKNTSVTDLPGIYSMSPYSAEELVSRNFLLKEKPGCIINIVDATNIERNLYLTMQLLEMGIPVVIALNMMDEMRGNGGSVDINAMEEFLGTPVVPIAAAKREGIDELIKHALHVAKYQEVPLRQDFCDETDHGGAVHRCLHAVIHLIEDHAKRADFPVRFAAAKLIEGDSEVLKKLDLDQNEIETVEHIVLQMEKERGLDRSAAIADMRFSFIHKVCETCVHKPERNKEYDRSRKIDRILTGKWTAIPLFILIMGIIFFLTFNVIGALLQDLLSAGIDGLTSVTEQLLLRANVNDVIRSLIIDGIFEGVGSVLSFLPVIVTMFFFLSILEDSGYIARVAFCMDRIFRRLGLSGRSIVPMLLGFGCTVPAIMSTRTLPSERDRKMTILLTPFMSCTAKLPIYAFFVDAFFPDHKALIMIGLYLFGILCSIIVALLYKKTMFKGEAVPFVMELPNYRLPGVKNVTFLLWEKCKDFLQRAFSVILVASVVVWFLESFDFTLHPVVDSHASILASIAGLLAPLFIPVGLGDWRIVTSLISGFLAKESVVSVLEVLFRSEGGVHAVLSPLSVASLLVFCLLYTPCVAAVAAVKRELGHRYAWYVVIWQCFVAWIAALFVRLIFSPFLS